MFVSNYNVGGSGEISTGLKTLLQPKFFLVGFDRFVFREQWYMKLIASIVNVCLAVSMNVKRITLN